jgi:hypothetical protein
MGRHHRAEVTDAADVTAMALTPAAGFPVIPAPRISPERVPTPRISPERVPEPRGWRARRVARAEAAAGRARDLQIAHAQRRSRQVALASLPVD